MEPKPRDPWHSEVGPGRSEQRDTALSMGHRVWATHCAPQGCGGSGGRSGENKAPFALGLICSASVTSPPTCASPQLHPPAEGPRAWK